MRALMKLLCLLLLLPFIVAGCGCGGDGESGEPGGGTPVDLIAIEVTPADPAILLGSVQQFAATGIFSDNTRRDVTDSVIWTSSAENVATISNETGAKGLAASHAVGSTIITATSGSISGSTTLTVTAATLASITVLPSNPSIASGTLQQFTAIGTFSDSTTEDITSVVTWSSSSPSIAPISDLAESKGLATGLAAGSTTVTASSGDISGSTLLTVTETSTGVTLVSIRVTPERILVLPHTTVQYTATGIYSDNTTKDITTVVTWSSSNTGVATISNMPGSKGLATTDGIIGETTITATLGSVSGSALLVDP